MEFAEPVKKNTRLLGKGGEEEAALFLVQKGYRIVDRNYAKRDGEIDIIARDAGGTLVFCEVKKAISGMAGDPAFWVNKKKQRQIGRMAQIYLAEKNIADTPCRFDVITIVAGQGREKASITHYENAFMLSY